MAEVDGLIRRLETKKGGGHTQSGPHGGRLMW
jgi:hypothetical protein